MKNTLSLAIAIITLFSLLGCTPKSNVQIPSGIDPDITINTYEDTYVIRANSPSYEMSKRIKSFRHTFNAAAKFGLFKGYSFMAMVNPKTNNLSGFPLNDWKNIIKYVKLDGTKHYRPDYTYVKNYNKLYSNNLVVIRAVYFKEAKPGLFLWDLKKLYRDTK